VGHLAPGRGESQIQCDILRQVQKERPDWIRLFIHGNNLQFDYLLPLLFV
jgi:hypothetical protein